MSIFESVDLAKFPKCLCKDNILSAVIDIRFKPTYPVEVIVGSLYSSEIIRKNYQPPQKTEINQIPQHIRSADPNLKQASLFICNKNDNKFRIGCGENSITLSNLNFTYKTWDIFSEELRTVLLVVDAFLKDKERIAVRYINAFDKKNILDILNINLKVMDNTIIDNNINFLFEEKIYDRSSRIKITNNANYNFFDIKKSIVQTERKASILDIDVIYTEKSNINANYLKELNLSHDVVKKIFLGILKKDYFLELVGHND